MGVYFDENGNLTQEKPKNANEWEQHYSYTRAFNRTNPDHRQKVTDEVREMLAGNQRRRFANVARVAYLKNGGSPKEWKNVKDSIIAAAIEAATKDSIGPLLKGKRNPTGF